MQQPPTNFLDWCAKHATEAACNKALAQHRWRHGFICPKCGHQRAYQLKYRHLRQCASCRHQVSPTAGTLFESSKVPLNKWFAAIYLVSADKGGISAQRLSKMIGVQWRTAHGMLRKLRQAMGERDQAYYLNGLVELDDAYIGGRRPGKRGRGAQGKTPVFFAVERRNNGMGYMAAQTARCVTANSVRHMATRLSPHAVIRTDAFPALGALGDSHCHESQKTPPDQVDQWLPSVHIVIGNFKKFINGTFHGVSHKYLQEYVNEFVFRFNRRAWEDQLPMRLVQAAIDHLPVRLHA